MADRPVFCGEGGRMYARNPDGSTDDKITEQEMNGWVQQVLAAGPVTARTELYVDKTGHISLPWSGPLYPKPEQEGT